MNPRVRAGLLILLIVTICAGLVGGAIWYRSRTVTTAALLRRMPTIDSMVVFIDFDKLRQAGLVQLLDGSKVGEDPDYQAFARKTDFHWAQDLDSALLAIAPSGKYIAARGRFDWTRLRAFASSVGGDCYNTLCRMPGSTQDRHISFLPLQSNLIGMAVSTDDAAATRLTAQVGGPDSDIPDAPFWLSIPASVLKSDALPEGTVSFARSVADSDRVTLAFVPDGKRLAAKLTVVCRNEEDAAKIARDLTKKTEILRSMLAHAHARPNPADLTGVLNSGSFEAKGRRAFGYWPIEPIFVETALGSR